MTPDAPLAIICLCADWCGTCREYRLVFDALQADWPGHRFVWVDVEDEADDVGDMDIETFPTLVVSARDTLLFAGPVLPRLTDSQRLLDSLAAGWREGTAPPASRLASDLKLVFEGLIRTVKSRAG